MFSIPQSLPHDPLQFSGFLQLPPHLQELLYPLKKGGSDGVLVCYNMKFEIKAIERIQLANVTKS